MQGKCDGCSKSKPIYNSLMHYCEECYEDFFEEDIVLGSSTATIREAIPQIIIDGATVADLYVLSRTKIDTPRVGVTPRLSKYSIGNRFIYKEFNNDDVIQVVAVANEVDSYGDINYFAKVTSRQSTPSGVIHDDVVFFALYTEDDLDGLKVIT